MRRESQVRKRLYGNEPCPPTSNAAWPFGLLWLAGGQDRTAPEQRPRYLLVDLPDTLGGTTGAANSINNRGWALGAATLAGNTTEHATAWIYMSALPTLGGNDSVATGDNKRGQIAGWAETTVHDPTCIAPQVPQFEAVVYGPEPEEITELPPPPGNSDAAATAINDLGQVVGISGICANAIGGATAAHAGLWENGMPTNMGNLGGVACNTPTSYQQPWCSRRIFRPAGRLGGQPELPALSVDEGQWHDQPRDASR